MDAPLLLFQRGNGGAEARRIEAERRQLGGNRLVQPHGCGDAARMQRLGPGAVDLLRRAFGAFEVGDVLFAMFDGLEPGAQLAHRLGQVVDLAIVLAGERTQFEQAGLDPVEFGGIVLQGFGGGLQSLLRLARLDHRPVETGQRLCQQRMLLGYAVEPAGGTAHLRERCVGAIPEGAQFFEVTGQPLALLHVGAGIGELFFLACLRFDGGEFGKMGEQQVLVTARLLDRRARLFQPCHGRSPALPRLSHARHVTPGIAIQQGAMAARIDEATVVMLAVQLDQQRGDAAQKRHADWLVVDESLGAQPTVLAIGRRAREPQVAANDQGFTGFQLDPCLVEGLGERCGPAGKLERGGNAGLVFARAQQGGIGAIAEHQPQRIEQDRLAGTRLAGQDAESRPEREVECLDQHDIPDRKRGQHGKLRSIRAAWPLCNLRPTDHGGWLQNLNHSMAQWERFAKAMIPMGEMQTMSVLTIRAHKRYAVRLPVELHKKGRKPARGLLIELSQQGARISNLGGRAYQLGDEVTVLTDCGRELPGTVRWSHDGLAGIRLDRTLHAPELKDFLEANRDAQSAGALHGASAA